MKKVFDCVEALKSTVRTGWMQRGVPPSVGEDIASHSFEAAMISLLISERLSERGIKVDVMKTAALALVHDFPECVVGDLNHIVKKAIGGEVKHKIELEALQESIPEGLIVQLYREYSEKKSMESKIAELSDKLATVMQARRYEKQGYDFEEMISNLEQEIKEMLEGMEEKERSVIEEMLRNEYQVLSEKKTTERDL